MNILETYHDAQCRRYHTSDPELIAKLDKQILDLTPSIALLNRFYAWDVETYPNGFTVIIKHVVTGTRWIYEISDWRNDSAALVGFIYQLKASGAYLVGFNSVGFDYPVLHHCIKIFERQGYFLASDAKSKQLEIFASQDDNRFGSVIWENDRLVPQIDLYKVHHFDNKAKRTGLKALEFNMRSGTIGEIPHDPNQPLTYEQLQDVLTYNAHDVNETIRFLFHSFDMIKFRHDMTVKLNKDFMNHNDTKIGKDYFIMQLEAAVPGICFTGGGGNGRKEPRQTHRKEIPLRDIIFPYVRFQTPEFNKTLDYLRNATIQGHETNKPPEIEGLTTTLRDFEFVWGGGGMHGSVKNKVVAADGEYLLIDVDVKSFYPNLAIKNRVYPEHLSETFCDIYSDLYVQRSSYPKTSVENAMLKLALNGVYGDSNNVYSPFYDPKYTMTITINGQLLLCMLAETFLSMIGIELVQINTDGMTVRMHRDCKPFFERMCKEWEAVTGLELESVEYAKMFIRDVNNYIAVDTSGKIKRKGVYQHDTSNPNNVSQSRTWSQDWSALVIPKAAEAAMLKGTPVAQFVAYHNDPFDFMLRGKVTGKTRMVLHHNGQDAPILGKLCRYHIATAGPSLIKIMPPLAKKPDHERRMEMEKGWSVNLCNTANEFDWNRLDRSYYIKEAEKLLGMLK